MKIKSSNCSAGVCNRYQNVCLALTLWNEQDRILKERFFGLNGDEGNHGEDVKEYYFYLDSTPTHSYMKMLYKYPQGFYYFAVSSNVLAAYPYEDLMRVNAQRTRKDPEYELIDTGVFKDDKYFDVFVEYAKADQEDILCQIQVINRGPSAAPIHILPTVWFRNTWSWGYEIESTECPKESDRMKQRRMSDADLGFSPIPLRTGKKKPVLRQTDLNTIEVCHRHLGTRYYYVDGNAELLFTENNTNYCKLFGDSAKNETPYVKDGINDTVVNGAEDCCNPDKTGTKAAAWFKFFIPAGGCETVKIRFSDRALSEPFADFDSIIALRHKEADQFYGMLQNGYCTDDDLCSIQRQAFAGLLWSKQYYHYGVDLWLHGDPAFAPPPAARLTSRNAEWKHVYCNDVLSMPDKWEYPWFAAWDLVFHCIPLCMVDPEWAQRQMIILLREWYMHPSGQIPAYEWNFSDVNPPVHAWAALEVYRIIQQITKEQCTSTTFLEKIFHKLLLNFTWWVNRKDAQGKNIFEGGFLGLDNIGVFDRSSPLPTGGHLEQADGTAWMAMYCLNMLSIALEIAQHSPAYEDIASKFLEHFIFIASAMSRFHRDKGLWDSEDGFFYDCINFPDGKAVMLKVQSLVGLVPLLAVATIDYNTIEKLPKFRSRFLWFKKYRPNLVEKVHDFEVAGNSNRVLFSIVDKEKLTRILERMLDEEQFLSPYGIRSLSKYHQDHPFIFYHNYEVHRVDYDPAESSTYMFGGNSNWRGPIWFPLNYLLIQSLRKYHDYFQDEFKIEFPTGSGVLMNLEEVACKLSERLMKIFVKDGEDERRAFNGGNEKFNIDPHWKDHILFYEYFHADTGAGLGASHQTGWTALVAEVIDRLNARCDITRHK